MQGKRPGRADLTFCICIPLKGLYTYRVRTLQVHIADSKEIDLTVSCRSVGGLGRGVVLKHVQFLSKQHVSPATHQLEERKGIQCHGDPLL